MTLLDNRYQVTRELGEGAFGKTYIAIDTRSPSKRQCVVKQLKLVATPEQNRFYQGLFEREAEVLEQIGHKAQGRIPNLLAYFTQSGDHFFVMELVSGPTLADCIARVGRQDEATVRGWLVRILETLDFIHGVEYTDTQGKKFRGVIHRDIKPGNIIIRESDGAPVLIDFGVVKEIAARSTIRNDGTMTMTAGTPFFMPPEQEKGQPVVASDLYALGVSAMVALTGKQPVELYDLSDLSFEWRKFAPGISPQLADALDKATQNKARDRFQTAREMIRALSPRPSVTQPPIPAPSPAPLPQTLPPPPPPNVSGVIARLEDDRKQLKTASKRPFIYVGLALLLVVFGGGGLATWYLVTKRPSITGKIGDSIKLPSGIEVMYIPKGAFQMGSENGYWDEKPVHRVVISEPFFLGKYEVTQAQWESVMGMNPSYFQNCPQCPVENVSWDNCQEFIRKLNAKGDGYTYRLPTEAEWEYACRSETTGDYAAYLDAIGWYKVNSGSKTHPVGQMKPNAWGLHDMHGNVNEWCADSYSGNYYNTSPTNDPKGPPQAEFKPRPVANSVASIAHFAQPNDSNKNKNQNKKEKAEREKNSGVPTGRNPIKVEAQPVDRVVRGGSWFNIAADCRSAFRLSSYYRPYSQYSNVGVRVVVVPSRKN
jgi:formylglycine-generating enzyme required for sulfatase activity